MLRLKRIAVALASAAIITPTSAAGRAYSFVAPEERGAPPPSLVEMAERYCISPDGDHEWTWALARHDGYRVMTMDDTPGVRSLPGARRMRAFTKTVDNVELRIVTAVNRIRGGGQGVNYFHVCWVSANPADRRVVDRRLREVMDVRRFREDGAIVYPWTMAEDGSRRSVSRTAYNRTGPFALTRLEGVRLTVLNDYLGMVSIGNMSPVPDCADWCY